MSRNASALPMTRLICSGKLMSGLGRISNTREKEPTYLIAFIDDCSLHCPCRRVFFYREDRRPDACFRRGALAKGLPRMVMRITVKFSVRINSSWHVPHLASVCCTRGYMTLQRKVKIERLFGNISQRFMPLFRQEQIANLDDLNTFFLAVAGTGVPPQRAFCFGDDPP